MTKIKKGDFIEIDYVGIIKGTNRIFDLTNEKVAKENNLYNSNIKYNPIIICIGENQIINGLDSELEGKEIGKYTIEVPQEKAFGKKNPRLMKIVQINIFLKQNINPFPGLQVDIDNAIGVIRSVSGGRCIVDFNHPLAGKDLVYKVDIIKKIDSPKEKLKGLLNNGLFVNDEDFEISLESDIANIKIKKDIPEDIKMGFKKRALELIKDIKDINFGV